MVLLFEPGPPPGCPLCTCLPAGCRPEIEARYSPGEEHTRSRIRGGRGAMRIAPYTDERRSDVLDLSLRAWRPVLGLYRPSSTRGQDTSAVPSHATSRTSRAGAFVDSSKRIGGPDCS